MKAKFSSLAISFVSIILFWSCFNLKVWNSERLMWHDVGSYYVYLPAFFIERDLKLNFRWNPEQEIYNNISIVKASNGNLMTKMGIGTAYLYAPYFFIGHFAAPLFNYPSNGFSKPYYISLIIGAIIYGILGLYFLSKILLFYFEGHISSIIILLIGTGTNFLCYTTIQPLMSHVFSFFLISAFIYLSIKWHKNPSLFISALAGLIYGIIVVARPTNALVIIFPILLNIRNIESIKGKIVLIKKSAFKLMISLIFFLIPLIPQLLYWKYVTGEYVYYSYNNEGFFFSNPHIIEGLFGFRKGWFIYTPVMIFSVLGLYFVFKRLPDLFLSVTIFFMINTYVIFSWWCWWYGGGFSSRPLIDSYSIMAIPFAALANFCFNRGILCRVALAFLSIIFITLNCFQTYQFKKNIIHYDSMTKEAYIAVFGTLKFPNNYDYLIKAPDYESAMKYGTEDN